MSYQPGLDVVVTNYRTPGDLQNFLDSLEKFSPVVPYTVIIANVSPEKEDDDVATRWAWKHGAQVQTFRDNVGYGKACNVAATRSWRECIAVFNADVVLSKDALNSCYTAIMANQRWGIVGPSQINQQNRFTAAGIFGTVVDPRHRGWMETDHGQYQDVREDAIYVAGSAMFIRREVWEKLTYCPIYKKFSQEAVGPLLETKHFFEETYFCAHAREHGYLCVYKGDIRITHLWHQASPLGGWADRQFPESKKMFQKACAAHGMICES